MGKDKRLPMPEGSVPNLEDPWDNGTEAFTTTQLREFIQGELRARKVKGVTIDGAEVDADDDGRVNISTANVAYINAICPNIDYTLGTAIAALSAYEDEHRGYVKAGMVMVYRTDEHRYEARMLHGVAEDINELDLWRPLAEVEMPEANATPEEGGTDAFSTGGAYRYVPTQLCADTSTEGVVKLTLANESGEAIGNEVQFAVGSGSGNAETGGTVVTVTPERTTVYGKAGGDFVIRASVRSVTIAGGTQDLNRIERIEVYDRDTNRLLSTVRYDRPSSETEVYDFEIDLSRYFRVASTRRLHIVAYDDTEHSGSRNIYVNSVDVTVKSAQILNYTTAGAITIGGGERDVTLYRFPSYTNGLRIECRVDIYVGGSWRHLTTSTVKDAVSHSVRINPSSCAGYTLSHGAYPVRIHGVDTVSGVEGNYLYTTIMVIDPLSDTPIVGTRWSTLEETATVRRYESVEIDFAVYDPTSTTAVAVVRERVGSGALEEKQTVAAKRHQTYTYKGRVSVPTTDGTVTLTLKVSSGDAESIETRYNVLGTVLDITAVTANLEVDIDMEGRSNSDTDKSITSNGHTLTLQGANYTTNGFVKDSYGTSQYETDSDRGEMSLRVAEGVTGELDYAPFDRDDIETVGAAVEMRLRVRNATDSETPVISCMSAGGQGFKVTGSEVTVTTDNCGSVAKTIRATLPEDKTTDVAIVWEPKNQVYSGIGCIKLYFDGELIGACYYDENSITRHATTISLNGEAADLYLYGLRMWESSYGYIEALDNYLLGISDTDSMVEEYTYNDVMDSQQAEGEDEAQQRPQADALYERGIAYFTLCKSEYTADDDATQYPDWLEGKDGDKSTTREFDITARFPDRPWQDFEAKGVPTTNQGTTSSKRPIKNIKMRLKKCRSIRLLHARTEFSGADLSKYDECAANIANKRVQVRERSLPTNLITVKVDYSESGGANNGASCQLYNELQRALGANYRTPAQNAYTSEKYELNTSIDSIPVAYFRTDSHTNDSNRDNPGVNYAEDPSYGYFHAKGNWNFDKGDPTVFGFEKVAGYNSECLNYGDFIELVAAEGQSLEDFAELIDKEQWARYTYMTDGDGNNIVDEETGEPIIDQENIYVLSEYCGPGHKVYRYREGTGWEETTGRMWYEGGRWHIEGDVVNPVENYEMKVYDGLCWMQGVNGVSDMMRSGDDGKPLWMTYYESRYPDDDSLTALYESGMKVPYRLYKWLRWCQACNHHLDATDGQITIDGTTVSGTQANRLKKFERELHTEANVHSVICYHVFTDYIAAVDQRSKNMMVGFYLEPDGRVRMYLNHLYDGDTILGSDNDCGLTVPAELDTATDRGYYQGWDSVLFQQLTNSGHIWLRAYESETDVNDSSATTTVAAVAKAMRECEIAGSRLRPFSPAGIRKYWITDRLSKWPKVVSSYDGIRKYIKNSKSTANYFYALHGLSTQRLEEFVKIRFLYRDGYYRCGDSLSKSISMRCTGTNMSVTITAAKDGYFGLGVDRADSARQSVYLRKGESAVLNSGATNTASGYMLYVFGADRIGELDLRGCTPLQAGWDISTAAMLKRLVLGGPGYVQADASQPRLEGIDLGQMPFLEEIEATNFTTLSSIGARLCPRLKRVKAAGTSLTSITLAETAPIELLQLPGTMNALKLVNLPALRYPMSEGLGLDVPLANITELEVSGCGHIRDMQLVSDWLDARASVSGCKLKMSGIAWTNVDYSDLERMMTIGTLDLEGTIALSAAPTGDEAAALMRRLGADCFGGSGRLTITAAGSDVLVAVPKYVWEGTEYEMAVIPLSPEIEAGTLEIEASGEDGVETLVDPTRRVVTLSSGEAGVERHASIHVTASKRGGATVDVTVDVLVRALVYPTNYQVVVPAEPGCLRANGGIRLELSCNAGLLSTDDWSVVWDVSGDVYANGGISIVGSGKNYCSLAAAQNVGTGAMTVTAIVMKRDGHTEHARASATLWCKASGVLLVPNDGDNGNNTTIINSWMGGVIPQGQNYLTESDMAAENDGLGSFYNTTAIKDLSVYGYFTKDTEGHRAPSGVICNIWNLETIVLPPPCVSLFSCLRNCPKLKSVTFPAAFRTLYGGCFIVESATNALQGKLTLTFNGDVAPAVSGTQQQVDYSWLKPICEVRTEAYNANKANWDALFARLGCRNENIRLM